MTGPLNPTEQFEMDLHSAEEAIAYMQKYVEESTVKSEEKQKMLKDITANLKALRESFEDEMMERS